MSGRLRCQSVLQSLAIAGEIGCYRTTRDFWLSLSPHARG